MKSPFKKKLSHLFRRLLEVFDMFAVKPSDVLTFKKEFYYSNWFTKTITLVIALLAVIYLILQIVNVVQLKNPNINYYETYTVDPNAINFGDQGFFIAFGLQNTLNNEYVDPKSYMLSFEALNKTSHFREISLISCDMVNNKNFSSFKKSLQEPSMFYCLENYKDLLFTGTWDSNIFLNYRLKIRPQSTNSTIDNIIKLIETSAFIMKYSTSKLDLSDADNPLQIIVGDYFHTLDPNNLIEICFGFAPIYFQNKQSSFIDFHVPVYKTPKLGIVYSHETYSAKERQNNSVTEEFFNINLRLTQIEKQYNRTYPGLLEAFSNVGGIFNFVTILFNVFLLNFLRNALIQRVSNEVLDYQEYIQMVDKQGENNSLENSHRKIKLSLFEAIKQCLPCFLDKKKRSISKVRTEILKIARKEMKKNYDIANILSRLNECEKIQYVLSAEQYKKFNEMSKPKICIFRPSSKEFKDERQKKFYKSFYIHNNRIPLPQEMGESNINADQKMVKPKSFSHLGTRSVDNSPIENTKIIKFLRRGSTKKEIKEKCNLELIVKKVDKIEKNEEVLDNSPEKPKKELRLIGKNNDRFFFRNFPDKNVKFENDQKINYVPKKEFITLEDVVEENHQIYESDISAIRMMTPEVNHSYFKVELENFDRNESKKI